MQAHAIKMKSHNQFLRTPGMTEKKQCDGGEVSARLAKLVQQPHLASNEVNVSPKLFNTKKESISM